MVSLGHLNNPFTSIADDRKLEVVDRWLTAKAIENKPCGWDLMAYEEEWGIYRIGELKELARMAGFGLEVEGIDLQKLLADDVVTEMFEDEWIDKIKDIDEVYLDIVLDYVDTLGLQPSQFIKIT
jgi:hypothetical protein